MAWKYALVLLVAIVVPHIEAKKGTATKTLANTACIDDCFVYCSFRSSRSQSPFLMKLQL